MKERLYSIEVDQKTFLAVNAYVRWLEEYNLGRCYTPGYVVDAAMRVLWAAVKGHFGFQGLRQHQRQTLDG